MLNEIDKELRSNIDISFIRKTHLKLIRYKDYYGVRTSINREISLKYFNLIKEWNKDRIFDQCKKLLESEIHEKKTIAFDWAFRLKDKYVKDDFYLFESWLYKYVNSYALCDDFCGHTLGEIIHQYPVFLSRIYNWIKEDNFWLRRAGAVTLIYLTKKLDVLEMSFDICKKLFNDKEDLVQKGFGWLLKELSDFYEYKVFDFLNTYKSVIPRVALRYAIEKMPKDKKKMILNR